MHQGFLWLKIRLHLQSLLRFLVRFSSCERVNELWMFRWRYINSECSQLISSFTCVRRRKSHYTAKNAEPAAQQDWTMLCCPRCSHLSTILNNVVEPESGVTILFNIVDNYEQCGQQNIVQSCFHQYCNNLIVFCRVEIAAKLASVNGPLRSTLWFNVSPLLVHESVHHRSLSLSVLRHVLFDSLRLVWFLQEPCTHHLTRNTAIHTSYVYFTFIYRSSCIYSREFKAIFHCSRFARASGANITQLSL